jgi:hypothetical protein
MALFRARWIEGYLGRILNHPVQSEVDVKRVTEESV